MRFDLGLIGHDCKFHAVRSQGFMINASLTLQASAPAQVESCIWAWVSMSFGVKNQCMVSSQCKIWEPLFTSIYWKFYSFMLLGLRDCEIHQNTICWPKPTEIFKFDWSLELAWALRPSLTCFLNTTWPFDRCRLLMCPWRPTLRPCRDTQDWNRERWEQDPEKVM